MQNREKVSTTSARIREAMRVANMKQADLARATGLGKGGISNYVTGRYEPKSDAISKLAKALNCSEMWLWGYDVPMERKTVRSIDSKAISKNIEEFREKALISQTEFARLIGVDINTVIDIESGKFTPSKELLFRICDVLQTTPDFLDGTIVELLEDGDSDAEYRYSRQQMPSPENLTEGEQVLLNLFRRVPEEQQQLVLQMIRAALGNPKQ